MKSTRLKQKYVEKSNSQYVETSDELVIIFSLIDKDAWVLIRDNKAFTNF